MKFTIHGFSQQKAIELGLSNDDLLTLRWIIDFSQTGKMKSIYKDGKMFYWVNYKSLLSDIPILGIKKDTLYRRLKKMATTGVLSHTTVIDNGTYSYYGVGDRYIELLDSHYVESQYSQDYGEGTDTNPRVSDINPNGTDMNPRGGTDGNPNGTDLNPEQRPYIQDKSTNINQSTKKEKEPTLPEVDPSKGNTNSVNGIIPQKQKKDDVFSQFAKDDTELLETLRDFENMRKLCKKPMTDRAKKILVNKLEKEFKGRDEQIATLEQSIERNYSSIYPVKHVESWGVKKNSANPDYSYGTEGVDHL